MSGITLIKELGKKHTVILSTHILSEVQAVCDRIIIINKGKIAATGSVSDFTSSEGTVNKFMISLVGNKSNIQKCKSTKFKPTSFTAKGYLTT